MNNHMFLRMHRHRPRHRAFANRYRAPIKGAMNGLALVGSFAIFSILFALAILGG